MKNLIAIWLLFIATMVVSCKVASNNGGNATLPIGATEVDSTGNGAITEGMAINIDGTLWHAENYSVNQMGTFWVIKGSGADTSVFSIMLPKIKSAQYFQVEQGGEVSVTYSIGRTKGFLFFAPFAENNGWVKTELLDGYLTGNFEVNVSNGALTKKCTGMFSIKMP